jgi:hypothetical protein
VYWSRKRSERARGAAHEANDAAASRSSDCSTRSVRFVDISVPPHLYRCITAPGIGSPPTSAAAAAAAAAAASAATAQPGAPGLVWEGLLSVALYSRTLPGQETPTSSHSLLCTPHDSSRAGAVDRDGHRRTRPARLACRADQAQPHELNNHLRRTNRETEKESQPDTHTHRAFMCIRLERVCRIRVKCCTGIAGQVTCATPTTAGAAAEMAKPAG